MVIYSTPTTSPQQIHSISTTCTRNLLQIHNIHDQLVVQQIHNKSYKWSLGLTCSRLDAIRQRFDKAPGAWCETYSHHDRSTAAANVKRWRPASPCFSLTKSLGCASSLPSVCCSPVDLYSWLHTGPRLYSLQPMSAAEMFKLLTSRPMFLIIVHLQWHIVRQMASSNYCEWCDVGNRRLTAGQSLWWTQSRQVSLAMATDRRRPAAPCDTCRARRTYIAYTVHDLMTSRTWSDADRPFVIVTLRILRDVTRAISVVGGGDDTFVYGRKRRSPLRCSSASDWLSVPTYRCCLSQTPASVDSRATEIDNIATWLEWRQRTCTDHSRWPHTPPVRYRSHG